MAGGSPSRQGPGRRAASGGRGAGLCLHLLWATAAAAVLWTSALPNRSSGSGLKLELVGRSRAAAAASDGQAGGSPAVTPAALEAAGPAGPQPDLAAAQPQHKFLMFFSGHQVRLSN